MDWFLSKDVALKWLEVPGIYHIGKDELYEVDAAAFEFLRRCADGKGCSAARTEFIDYCLEEGILTPEVTDAARLQPEKSPVPSLRYLELQVTDRCNLRCRHCYIGDAGARNELSLKQIRNVLTGFEKMQGLRVMITGGEPLIHPSFPEINNMLPEFSLRKVLFTNGLLLTGKMVGSLNVDEVQVSIDGLEKAHDALRGKGSFSAALGAVRTCRDAGMEVSVSTMVHSKNLQDFDKMERLFGEEGVKDWTVDVPCPAGRLNENSTFRITPEQGGRYLRYGHGEGLHASSPGYGCGLHLMSALADGRVSKCTFYGDRAAGRIEDGIRECWARIRPVILDDLDCDCEYIGICRGGCRYRAEVLGDPKGKDLYKCFSYDIIKPRREGKKP
jgi:radical SAM protein with 4Fe4S-binding SPASM domain